MSNVIKAYTVRYNNELKKTIDTQINDEKIIEDRQKPSSHNPSNQPEGFVEGLKAVVVEPIPNEEMKQKNSRITEEAKAEAKRIIDQAKREARQLQDDTAASAQKKGYEEGILQAKKEIQKLKTDYDEKSSRLQKEYDEMLYNLEPQISHIVAALVEKVTGILTQDKEEVIFYLVEKAIRNLDKCSEYGIRVSKEDYEYILARKNLLLSAVGREVPIYITEDPSLKKNQCLIETELKVINCSLDIQLNNLITDLKLIGGI